MAETSGGKQLIDPSKVLEVIGLKPAQVVADLGCGALGYFTFAAAKVVGKKGLVYAIDVRQIVLAGIRNRARIDGLDNIRTVWANLEVLKSSGVKDESVDHTFLFNMLFQNKKREEILTESVRITKPGGRLVIIDWARINTSFGPPLEDRVNPVALRQYVESKGFTLEKEFVPGDYHFGLLFIKNTK